MQPLEYDIRHFPFSRYGAMVAVSRDLQKDELVLHDVRAHDGQDRALRMIFSDRPIVPKDDEDLKEIPGIPFQPTGTPSRLFITAAGGKADIIISGDHRLRIQAQGLFLLLTPCRKDGSTAVMKDQKHVESICPSACRYARIDMEKGSVSLLGETTLRGGQYPAKRMTSVMIAPENGIIDFQVQLAQSPALVDEGYEGIELDIRMSRDGEIVVCHDSHFSRLTCGHPTRYCIRHLEDMTWEELSRIELPYALHLLPEDVPSWAQTESLATLPWQLLGDYETAYQTEPRMARLMRFQDFDAWLSRQKRKITVEVEFCAPGMMQKMLEILDCSENRDHYILFSGQCDIIDDMQRTCRLQGKPQGIRLGANIRWLTPEMKEYIRNLDLFEVGLNDQKYTADDVKYLNDRGTQVLSNLGDYPRWWEEMCRTGALGFKTNYAAAFTKWWFENNG